MSSSSTATSPSSLVNHLEKSFSKLPNPHTVHFTALTSSPKRTTSLYPYTTHHPRCFQVDYLITLACEVERPLGQIAGLEGKSRGNGETRTGQGEGSSTLALTASDTIGKNGEDRVQMSNGSSIDQRGEATTSNPIRIPIPIPRPKPKSEAAPEPNSKIKSRVMTTALSAHLYILPHHRTSILYISKLDSSGYPTIPIPLTRTFITSTLTYFLSPQTRPTPYVRIQLFARSQGQYLFPNSSQGPKKVLGGLGLCGWWKGVYEDVAAAARESGEVKLGMVLPGYSADEAKGMLGQKKPLAEGLAWTSNPPFTTPLPPVSNSTSSSSSSSLAPSSSFTDIDTGATSRPSLASLIPSLPDDPKARFLDDLVSEGAEDPQRRRQLLKPKPDGGGTSSASIQSTSTATSPGKKKDPLRSKVKAEDEAERRFTSATLERVSIGEYWERMGFRQECISGDVTGFFTLESGPPSNSGSTPMQSTSINTPDPKPSRSALPPGIVDRILQALLNTDFKSFDTAIDQSELWQRSVKSLVVDEIGEEGYKDCIGLVEGKEGEVVAPVKRKEEAVVTMLQPRKKKKVQP